MNPRIGLDTHPRSARTILSSEHNLHGLNENSLDALAKTVGFVTVLHGRGGVVYGTGEVVLVRASVWIEQEIAIAAYIARTSGRPLLTAAYIENGVGREGIRDLLHLNPLPFTSNDEVLTDLKVKLHSWAKADVPQSSSEDKRGKLELKFQKGYEAGLPILHLTPILINTGSRAKGYSCTLEVPDALLSWTNPRYTIEIARTRPGYRRFRVTDETKQHQQIQKGDSMEMLILQVSMAHLSADQREPVFKQAIYVFAELEESSYSLEVLCDKLF